MRSHTSSVLFLHDCELKRITLKRCDLSWMHGSVSVVCPSVRQCTPNLIMFGREVSLRLTVELGVFPTGDRPQCPVEYVDWVQNTLEKDFRFVRVNTESSVHKQKHYNARHPLWVSLLGNLQPPPEPEMRNGPQGPVTIPISSHGLTTSIVSSWVHLILSSSLSRKFRPLLQDSFSWHPATTPQHVS